MVLGRIALQRSTKEERRNMKDDKKIAQPKPEVRFTLGEILLAKNPKLTIGPLAPVKSGAKSQESGER